MPVDKKTVPTFLHSSIVNASWTGQISGQRLNLEHQLICVNNTCVSGQCLHHQVAKYATGKKLHFIGVSYFHGWQ